MGKVERRFQEASAIPFAALTAWRALSGTARITEGQRILIVGGGGAVGFTAIQIAVAAGCSVTTTCGPQSIERMLAAGAEQAVDYLSEKYELAIKGKFDAVLDTIGEPETEHMSINFLKKGGHYMTLQGENTNEDHHLEYVLLALFLFIQKILMKMKPFSAELHCQSYQHMMRER